MPKKFELKIIADKAKRLVVLDFPYKVKYVEFNEEEAIALIKIIWEKLKIIKDEKIN